MITPNTLEAPKLPHLANDGHNTLAVYMRQLAQWLATQARRSDE